MAVTYCVHTSPQALLDMLAFYPERILHISNQQTDGFPSRAPATWLRSIQRTLGRAWHHLDASESVQGMLGRRDHPEDGVQPSVHRTLIGSVRWTTENHQSDTSQSVRLMVFTRVWKLKKKGRLSKNDHKRWSMVEKQSKKCNSGSIVDLLTSKLQNSGIVEWQGTASHCGHLAVAAARSPRANPLLEKINPLTNILSSTLDLLNYLPTSRLTLDTQPPDIRGPPVELPETSEYSEQSGVFEGLDENTNNFHLFFIVMFVSWLHIFCNISRENCRTAITALYNILNETIKRPASARSLMRMPRDPRTLISEANLDTEIVESLCCRTCFHLYPQDTKAAIDAWARELARSDQFLVDVQHGSNFKIIDWDDSPTSSENSDSEDSKTTHGQTSTTQLGSVSLFESSTLPPKQDLESMSSRYHPRAAFSRHKHHQPSPQANRRRTEEFGVRCHDQNPSAPLMVAWSESDYSV
ncbi:hypothetical protein PGTUg99_000543 [Puccinia graminis f. sp. tritici]|uniref:Uncharacterized protein n=1 Tax=Puccinia graminis f. sp. tritici TaxID=56615 RepID=A0A5B0N8W8_PUCGR|nr:hypothetical protein PGTUg99_000543 [Puccinia graminis f. sp. tritici]